MSQDLYLKLQLFRLLLQIFANVLEILYNFNWPGLVCQQDMDRSDTEDDPEEEDDVHNEGSKEGEENRLSQLDFYQDNPFSHCHGNRTSLTLFMAVRQVLVSSHRFLKERCFLFVCRRAV